MSSYETLLENCREQRSYENDTFSNVAACLESLTSFVNEEVNFEMVITLEEAESGNIKDKANKLGASVKKHIDKLIAKLQAFFQKIGESLKRFVAKAKAVIACKGNEALAKMIKSDEFLIGKDIKVKYLESKDVQDLFNEAAKGAQQVYSVANGIDIKNVGEIELSNDTVEILDAFKEDITSSKAVKEDEIKVANRLSVKRAYEIYVKPNLDVVSKYMGDVEETCKNAQKVAKNLIKELNKAKTEKDVKAAAVSEISKISAMSMQISTAMLNYAFGVLTVTTKASAKIALAAVSSRGKAAADAVKSAPGKAKAAAKDKFAGPANKAMYSAEEKLSRLKPGKKED